LRNENDVIIKWKQQNIMYFHTILLVLSLIRLNTSEQDILYPYPSIRHHLDPRRSHRYVRDCQPKEHGNLTHETIKTLNSSKEIQVNYFRKDFTGFGLQFGHHSIIKDPASMISIHQPLDGGCQNLSTSTVKDTAIQNGCYIATNAGFFVPSDRTPYGACLGNIISDSKIIRKTGIQNANFGIRQDGSIVIGYLSEDEVTETKNPFIQLVTGVGWIIRNGKSYVTESIKAECEDTQTTSSMAQFFKVQSARTLLGVDGNGYVHLVTVDGKTYSRGINLPAAVKYLIAQGVQNAINLDGGGSATYVINSTVVNYPSDTHHDQPEILVPRKVSSIICVKKEMNGDVTPEHMASLSYCCNRNYLLIIGLTVIIGFSCLLHVHFYTLYQHYRNKVKDLLSGQQKKEALQSLLQQANNELSSEFDSDFDDFEDDDL